jgi:hypothetical protein
MEIDTRWVYENVIVLVQSEEEMVLEYDDKHTSIPLHQAQRPKQHWMQEENVP